MQESLHSTPHFTGLADFLSNSDIHPAGNKNTFDTEQPSRLICKNVISDQSTFVIK